MGFLINGADNIVNDISKIKSSVGVSNYSAPYGFYQSGDTVKNILKNQYNAGVNTQKADTTYWNVDTRVQLGVAKRNNKNFAERIFYVLGSGGRGEIAAHSSYGFLRRCLDETSGLIFPYTPQITENNSVKWTQTDIKHSNLSIQTYVNTPSPTYNISAKFTADTPEMALYMLGAMWFLRAVTKSDWGERAYELQKAEKNSAFTGAMPGMPPPTLYLSGFGRMEYDCVPVVVKNVSWTFPEDKDYSNVIFNMNNIRKYTDIFANPTSRIEPLAPGSNELVAYLCESTLTEIQDRSKNDTKASQTVDIPKMSTVGEFGENAFQGGDNTTAIGTKLNEWSVINNLPMTMTINIQLVVNPNVEEYSKNFSLYEYKTGYLIKDTYGQQGSGSNTTQAWKEKYDDLKGLKSKGDRPGYTW